mmetsp:Transcript_96037/g.215118  ORF Transcript_96037/g.215118 Transcript_96037/m.215118 type:complete len:285 (-) Transcript_96037:3709-4563(-)
MVPLKLCSPFRLLMSSRAHSTSQRRSSKKPSTLACTSSGVLKVRASIDSQSRSPVQPKSTASNFPSSLWLRARCRLCATPRRPELSAGLRPSIQMEFKDKSSARVSIKPPTSRKQRQRGCAAPPPAPARGSGTCATPHTSSRKAGGLPKPFATALRTSSTTSPASVNKAPETTSSPWKSWLSWISARILLENLPGAWRLRRSMKMGSTRRGRPSFSASSASGRPSNWSHRSRRPGCAALLPSSARRVSWSCKEAPPSWRALDHQQLSIPWSNGPYSRPQAPKAV